MYSDLYKKIVSFKRKYSLTLAFRTRKHCRVIEKILDKDEKVLYAFCGQKSNSHVVFFSTCVIALTNKRIIIGQKRVLWGYFVTSITPELFNDLKIKANLLWGLVIIDTAKEVVYIANLDKKSLDEIETEINRIMSENKRRINVN